MNQLLPLFVLLPVIGFCVSLLVPAKKENTLSRVVYLSMGLHTLLVFGYSIYWWLHQHETQHSQSVTLFNSEHFQFNFILMFDLVTATYLLTGAYLTMLVTIYSSYYLHRESGYKRYFNTILFFYIGYNITVMADNFETLFIGWEILGITSFLLIAFYRNRYLPVKNAVKIFSIYRIGDVGLLLAMWMSHHLWNESITFQKLQNAELVSTQLQSHTWIGVLTNSAFCNF